MCDECDGDYFFETSARKRARIAAYWKPSRQVGLTFVSDAPDASHREKLSVEQKPSRENQERA